MIKRLLLVAIAFMVTGIYAASDMSVCEAMRHRSASPTKSRIPCLPPLEIPQPSSSLVQAIERRMSPKEPEISSNTTMHNLELQLRNTHVALPTQSGLRLAAAHAEAKGNVRPTMEDASDVYNEEDSRFAFYAVYDGHGGADVAAFVKANLCKRIMQNLAQNKDLSGEQIQAAIRGGFAQTEEAISFGTDAGSTANVVIVDKHERVLYCANLGDTRAVIAKTDGTAVALSRDHKATDKEEAKRIICANGTVWYGRVAGMLAVSRAFGDEVYKNNDRLAQIMSEPEIQIHPLDEQDQCLIIACDGVWDVIANEEAVNFVRGLLFRCGGNVECAAKGLVQYALEEHSADNVTAIVVNFVRA